MKPLKIERFGETVQGIRLAGDRRNPEPETVRVMFPGGDVDVVRCSDGSYWVHVRVASEDEVLDESVDVAGRVVDVRCDYREQRRHMDQAHVEAALAPVPFGQPGPYHLAVRVARALPAPAVEPPAAQPALPGVG